MWQRGFTLIEAVVSISLFSLMILGATLQLRAYEDGQRSIADALVLVKTARTFLSELSQVSRREDAFERGSDGISRPDESVLDVLSGAQATYPNGDIQDGYDFYAASSNSVVLNPALDEVFEKSWNTEDENERTRLTRAIGRRADAWRINVYKPASGAYRIIELHLDTDDGDTNLVWPICCSD